MHLPPSKLIAVRLTHTLIQAAQVAAEKRGISMSDLIRQALQEVVGLDPRSHQQQALLYETAKTRAVLLRLLETQLNKEQVDDLLALAEEDARDYVREKHGTL